MDDQHPLPVTLIGLCGLPSAGQSTAASILAKDFAIRSVTMSGAARSVLLTVDPLVGQATPLSRVVGDLGWESALEHRVYGAEITGLLQRLRAAVTATVGEAAWMHALEVDVRRGHDEGDPPLVCVEGVSSDAEAVWIREHGGQVWLIDRPAAHREGSVPPVSQSLCDHVVPNGGTRTDLHGELAGPVTALLEEYRRARSRVAETDLDPLAAEQLLGADDPPHHEDEMK